MTLRIKDIWGRFLIFKRIWRTDKWMAKTSSLTVGSHERKWRKKRSFPGICNKSIFAVTAVSNKGNAKHLFEILMRFLYLSIRSVIRKLFVNKRKIWGSKIKRQHTWELVNISLHSSNFGGFWKVKIIQSFGMKMELTQKSHKKFK